jgi:uncharacterized protein YtpQ (UPF0354 family)
LLLLFVAVLMLFAGSASAKTLSPRAFADAVAAAAAATMPSAKVTVTGDLQVVVRYANGARATSNLDKSYKIYEQEPQRLDGLIQGQIAALLGAAGDANGLPKPERSLIIPVIKDRQWFDETQRRGTAQTPPLGLLAEPLNSELVVVYAEDRPGALRFLSTRDDVGDRAQLHDLALDNLRVLLPKIEMRTGADGIFLISAGGDFEASLLLTDELWSSGQIKVDGDIVVAVPAKDVLLVSGSHNRAGIARLRRLAADLATGPHALTSALFVYRNGKFVKFEPD